MYIFTDIKAKKILSVKQLNNGQEAADYREELARKLKRPVVSWCHMGLLNPGIEINDNTD